MKNKENAKLKELYDHFSNIRKQLNDPGLAKQFKEVLKLSENDFFSENEILRNEIDICIEQYAKLKDEMIYWFKISVTLKDQNKVYKTASADLQRVVEKFGDLHKELVRIKTLLERTFNG